MEVVICKTKEEASKLAADMVTAQVKKNPKTVLGLATGSTPVPLYNEMAKAVQAKKVSYKQVKSWNLDEYYGLPGTHDQSYRYFMNENLFSHVNVDLSRTFVPDGAATDPDEACRRYEEILASVGQVDIQVLGIGQNGHIGFNEPADTLCVATHVTDLTPSTIKANARFFASEAEVPTRALTMGMGTILRAKKILIMANGAAKRDAVATMLAGGLTTACPASLLNLHADVTLVCDGAALGR